ncbi:MAG TPA: TIGR03435 family protein [Acidobacteriaceae bacterium]|nr:TIGR03435 family protein [Acidobacteriaceae bacterium]
MPKRVAFALMWMGVIGCTAMAQSIPVSQVAATPEARPRFDAFEVASIKPVKVDAKAGRYFKMDGPHRWTATNFTLEALIALAYDLNPRTISGGPEWVRTERFVISAVTPNDVHPVRLEQMRMLRALLVDRFALKFHRQDKQMEIYELTVGKDGPKLAPAAKPDDPPQIVGVVFPDRIQVPARSVTMDDFVAMLQRATLDRPTVNRTGLTGKYDFDLKFAQDESQYGGEVPKAAENSQSPSLFTAVREQLGLKLTATRGTVSTMVVDSVQEPSAD